MKRCQGMFSSLNNRKKYLLTSVVLGVFGTLAHKIVFSGSVSGNNRIKDFSLDFVDIRYFMC